jgi:hypothetical protein
MLTIFTVLFGLFGYKLLKARLNLFNAEADLLRVKWQLARDRRKLWRDEHLSYFNHLDPEYVRLWEIEIGAEDLYLLHINRLINAGVAISWSDYKSEQNNSNPLED